MIDYIYARIVSINADSIIMDLHGVGFKVFVPTPSIFNVSEKVKVHTCLHFKDDELVLFGFPSPEEKSLFLLMQKVSGIGPKGALAILHYLSCEQFYHAVMQDNVPVLTTVPGIGPKLARRIILELKEKISSRKSSFLALENKQDSLANIWYNVAEALQVLGYSQSEISKAYHRLSSSSAGQEKKWGEEELIKEMLSLLSRG